MIMMMICRFCSSSSYRAWMWVNCYKSCSRQSCGGKSSLSSSSFTVIFHNHQNLIIISSPSQACKRRGSTFCFACVSFWLSRVTYRFYLDISEWLADLIAFLCLVCVSVYFSFFTVFIMGDPCWPTVHTLCSCFTQELVKSWQIQRPRKTLVSDGSDIFFFGAQII